MKIKHKLNKSSFSKLFLIEPDMFYKALSVLNEVDKQDLQSLNDEGSPNEVQTNTEVERKAESVLKPSQIDGNVSDQTVVPLPKEMKPKKFECTICVNKRFTTRHSLKRHNKTFHEKRNSL